MIRRLSNQVTRLLIAFVVSIICCTAPSFTGDSYFLYACMIGVNAFVATMFMLNDSERPYTLGKLINFFILLFFILANAIQFANHSLVLTFPHTFTYSDYVYFQILVFFILVSFNVLHDYFLGNEKKGEKQRPRESGFPFRRMLVLSCVATLVVLAHNNFSLYPLFFRGMTRRFMNEMSVVGPEAGGSLMSGLILNKVIRAIPWAVYILSCFFKCPKQQRLILFFPMMLTVFPTGLSRNAAAIYWIAVFILIFEKYLKRNRFIYTLILVFFILFPFLNNFRYFSGSLNIRFSYGFLDSMDMDASQIFMAAISVKMVTWGRQLLGALLFFVPRSIWPSKPVGSGYTLVTNQGGDFTNVSCPYFAEGYVNFGFIGVFLFILFIAYLSGRWDGQFWRNHSTQDFKPMDGYYLIMLGAIIFIMRGDLMSSFAYTVGTFISFFSVRLISRL